MSIVNQAEKDGILYDINDARVYTVDLGTLTLTPDDPNNPKSFSGNTTLTAEQFLSLQNSEIGFIKFTFNGTNIITTVNENLDHPEVTGVVTASTSMMMGGSFSAISVLAQYEGTLGETVPTQVIIVLDILADSANGAKIIDFGTVDGDISDPDNPYMTTITQEKFEEALEADIVQFTTTGDGGITFRALKMQLMPEQAGAVFTTLESEKRGLMAMVGEQNGSYMLMIGMTNRLLESGDKIAIENLNTSGATAGQVPTADGSGGVSWQTPAGITGYDNLTDIPIINQDLDEAGFTPVTQTYYRHVGMSATNFNIGKIYYYTGSEYKAIDGSGSSESIYELSGTVSSGDTISDIAAITVLNAHKSIIINSLQLYYNGIFNSQIQYTTRIMNTRTSLGNGKDFCDTKVYLFNPSTNKITIVEPHVWRHCFDIDFDNNSGISGHLNIEVISNSADFTDTGWETGRVLATLLYQSNLNSYDHLALGVTGYFSGDAKTILGLYSWDSNEVSINYYDPSAQTTNTFSLYKRNGSSPYDYITTSSYYADKIY